MWTLHRLFRKEGTFPTKPSLACMFTMETFKDYISPLKVLGKSVGGLNAKVLSYEVKW